MNASCLESTDLLIASHMFSQSKTNMLIFGKKNEYSTIMLSEIVLQLCQKLGHGFRGVPNKHTLTSIINFRLWLVFCWV